MSKTNLNEQRQLEGLLGDCKQFALAQGPRDIRIHQELRRLGTGIDDQLLSRLPEALRQIGLELRSAHEMRQREWAEGRWCELAIRNHLEGCGDVRTSVSHTGGWVAAVGAASFDPSLKGVGVDLERRDRRVSGAMRSRLLTPGEMQLSLTVLEAWVLKEASFKAQPGNRGTVLSDYLISEWDTTEGTGKVTCAVPQNKGEIRVILKKSESWLLAMALCVG